MFEHELEPETESIFKSAQLRPSPASGDAECTNALKRTPLPAWASVVWGKETRDLERRRSTSHYTGKEDFTKTTNRRENAIEVTSFSSYCSSWHKMNRAESFAAGWETENLKAWV